MAGRDRRVPGRGRTRALRRLPRCLAGPAADLALGDRADRPGGERGRERRPYPGQPRRPGQRGRPADRRDQPARGVRGPVRRAAGGEDDPPASGPAAPGRHADAGAAPRPRSGAHAPSGRWTDRRTPGPILACSATRPSFSRTHPPVASASASALWPGSFAATGTISPTITCARSRKPSGWPATWPPDQPGDARGR